MKHIRVFPGSAFSSIVRTLETVHVNSFTLVFVKGIDDSLLIITSWEIQKQETFFFLTTVSTNPVISE